MTSKQQQQQQQPTMQVVHVIIHCGLSSCGWSVALYLVIFCEHSYIFFYSNREFYTEACKMPQDDNDDMA